MNGMAWNWGLFEKWNEQSFAPHIPLMQTYTSRAREWESGRNIHKWIEIRQFALKTSSGLVAMPLFRGFSFSCLCAHLIIPQNLMFHIHLFVSKKNLRFNHAEVCKQTDHWVYMRCMCVKHLGTFLFTWFFIRDFVSFISSESHEIVAT